MIMLGNLLIVVGMLVPASTLMLVGVLLSVVGVILLKMKIGPEWVVVGDLSISRHSSW